jgi:hypothetical protein
MSVRASSGSPRICSGLAYSGVPDIAHRDVAVSSRIARPKSASTTRPPASTRMFAGFTSRWMTPASCAWARARATSSASRAASRAGSGVFGGAPSTNGITRYARPACWPRSKMLMIDGCESWPAMRPSRSILCVGCPISLLRCLTATQRPRERSQAFHTSAMPPVPSTDTST